MSRQRMRFGERRKVATPALVALSYDHEEINQACAQSRDAAGPRQHGPRACCWWRRRAAAGGHRRPGNWMPVRRRRSAREAVADPSPRTFLIACKLLASGFPRPASSSPRARGLSGITVQWVPSPTSSRDPRHCRGSHSALGPSSSSVIAAPRPYSPRLPRASTSELGAIAAAADLADVDQDEDEYLRARRDRRRRARRHRPGRGRTPPTRARTSSSVRP
jgi:hypothetical protein